jgi:hypothetical protein
LNLRDSIFCIISTGRSRIGRGENLNQDTNDYQVICNTCFKKFRVQLFDSHEKNLFVADKKDWYCDACKQEYFKEQTSKLIKAHAKKGFSELQGTVKQISWAEKIRAELINKVDFLKKSLVFSDDREREISDRAFECFLEEWQDRADAKWWIDNRRMTVRNISDRIKEIKSRDPK